MWFSKKNQAGVRARKHRMSVSGPVLCAVFTLTLAACSNLLDVDLPGSVTAETLDDPRLARTLVNTVIGDFECGLVDHYWAGQWMEEFLNSSTGRPSALIGARATLSEVYADPCDSGTGPIWTIFQVPIQDAVLAIELIEGFDQADVAEDKALLTATARLYEGFSIQLLGEAFCGVSLVGGPLLTRAEAYAQAADRFTQVIGSAAPASSAKDKLIAAALIGRARARLFQGDNAGVIVDASDARITEGFVLEATYETSPGRRNNRIAERNNVGDAMMPHRDYLDLTIDPVTGVLSHSDAGDSDPRVPIKLTGDGTDLDGPRGLLKYREQQKFPSEGSDIPFATWREAQTMIAEAQALMGNTAASIVAINHLRSNNAGLGDDLDSSAWPLTAYAGGTAAQVRATAVEERRRELWMQGNQAGDKLRWSASGDLTAGDPNAAKSTNDGGTDWEAYNEYGEAVAAGTCLRVPRLEVLANDNIS